MRRQAASLLVLLFAGIAAAAESPPAPRPPVVTVRDDKVTATLERAPLDVVIGAIAEQTGAEVKGEVAPLRDVTLELKAVPFEEAFERLLGTQSFTLTYYADGRLKRVALGGSEAGTPAATTGAPATGAPGHATAPDTTGNAVTDATRRVAEWVRSDPTVTLDGRLAKMLGTDTMTYQQLLGAALKNADPKVREEARRGAVKALIAEPEMHDALVTTIDSMSDQVIMEGLRNVGGADAAAVASSIARYGRSPVLSRRMHRAISLLRQAGDG